MPRTGVTDTAAGTVLPPLTEANFRPTIGRMQSEADSLLKHREIAFCTLHPDPDQAGIAAPILLATAGVQQVDVLGATLLKVSYHLMTVRLIDLEAMLEDHGLHLDNRLMFRIKRALYAYTEETQRANLGCPHGEANCTQKIFVKRYQNRTHGCQDERPEHWRKYR